MPTGSVDRVQCSAIEQLYEPHGLCRGYFGFQIRLIRIHAQHTHSFLIEISGRSMRRNYLALSSFANRKTYSGGIWRTTSRVVKNTNNKNKNRVSVSAVKVTSLSFPNDSALFSA